MLVKENVLVAEKQTTAPYFVHLDSLRVFFVSIVLLHHWLSATPFKFLPFGSTIAFVLSSFLLTNVLLKEKFQSDSYWSKTKRFLIRRFLRTLPIYLLLIFGYLVFRTEMMKPYILYYLTFTQNYPISDALDPTSGIPSLTHTWSLAVQEQFYIFLPITVFAIPRKYFVSFWVILSLAGLIIRFYYYFGGFPLEYNHFRTECCLDCFGVGVLISYLNFFDPERLKRILLNKTLLITILILYVLSLTGYMNAPEAAATADLSGGYNSMYRTTERTFVSILSIWFITWGIYFPSAWLTRISRNAIIHYLSKISYGIYVFHMLGSIFVEKLFVQVFGPQINIYSAPVIAVKFLVCIAIASISFYLIEKPIMSFRSKFKTPN